VIFARQREIFFNSRISAYGEDCAYTRSASGRNHTLIGEECITPDRNPSSDKSIVLQGILLIGGCLTKALVPVNGKDKKIEKMFYFGQYVNF
jgi:hypothetical protein